MKLKKFSGRKFNVLHPPVCRGKSGVGLMETDIEKINSKTGHTCTDRAVNSLSIMCGNT